MHVTTLPRALAPWADKLALFPRDLALSLAPLLPRLHGLLGAPGPSAGATGEPDGYDGIARRGSYERLLASEWLLLEEIPDEFLRRVVSSEHVFLHLARRPAVAGRHGVVLFDAGPEQLGAPRIAHLAALIVLAARLEEHKGTLSWGMLQDETATLRQGLSAASIPELFLGRAWRRAAAADVARWLGLGPVATASERWLVGAEDLRPLPLPPRTFALQVAEAVEVGARRLHVTAHAAGAARLRSVVLELPPERESIRLLRDPLAQAVTPRSESPVRIEPASGLVFSENGKRLYLRGAAGQLVTLVVPNSSKMPPPAPAVFVPPPGQTVVAAGIDKARRRTTVVCQGEHGYFAHRLSKSGRVASETDEFRCSYDDRFPAGGATGPLQALTFEADGGLRFLDVNGQGMKLFGLTALFSRLPDGGEEATRKSRVEPGLPFALPPATTLIDVLGVSGSDIGVRAVVLDSSRTRVLSVRDGGSATLFTTASPIQHVIVGIRLSLVAYVAEDGEVGVHSIGSGMVLKVAAGGSS